jgi:hypothetical protein
VQDADVDILPFDSHPTEDAGAATTDRFHFQHCCAAARLLAALAGGQACELICEWHEDYLVISNGRVEAVSVKHREDHLAAWSAASLVDDGKLGHLFATFCSSGVACYFESNRAHTVHDLWSSDAARREAARVDLAERLGADRAELDLFVDNLRIWTAPKRQDIEETYAARFASFALDRLGLNLDPILALRVTCSLVADASRGRVPDDAWAALLAAPPEERDQLLADRVFAGRRVDTKVVCDALTHAQRTAVPRLDASAGPAPPETTLTKKLRRGGLGPSVIETGRRRRRLWYSHVAEVRDIGEREAELASLREWVQDQANAAESEAMGEDPYGQQMHQALEGRLRSDAVPDGTRDEDKNPALLSGAAFELTDECAVWWSKPFDLAVDADVED